MERKKERLSAESWLNAGFRALVTKGPSGLKAEAIARDLGTTKGSFYWHFKDIPEFKVRMMAFWEEHALEGVVNAVDDIEGAEARLRLLIDIASADGEKHGGAAAEPAIRDWMRYDASVRKTVQRVDALRLEYLRERFVEAGIDDTALPRIFYSSLIGLEVLSISDGRPVRETMHSLLDVFLQA